MNKEEEVETAVDIIYPNRKIQKTKVYEPTVQGKEYKYDAGYMFLNYGDTLGSTRTKEDEI